MRNLLLLSLSFLAGCSSISFRGGPAKQQIKQDVTSSVETCMQLAKNGSRPYAQVDSVKITSTKIYNNEATVHVDIAYHWVGTPASTDTFDAVPCTYFKPDAKKNLVQPIVISRPAGNDWKLVEFR